MKVMTPKLSSLNGHGWLLGKSASLLQPVWVPTSSPTADTDMPVRPFRLSQLQRAWHAFPLCSNTNRYAVSLAHVYLQGHSLVDRDEFNLQEAFEIGRVTMQTVLAINGGAAVAILAFYGQALTSKDAITAGARIGIAASLTWFGAGVLLATSTLIIAYMVQSFWGWAQQGADRKAAERWAARLHLVAFLLALLSMAAFVGGCWSARGAILSSSRPSVAATVSAHRLVDRLDASKPAHRGNAGG